MSWTWLNFFLFFCGGVDLRRRVVPGGRDGWQARGPEARSRRARACKSEAKASCEGIVLRDDHDLVTVDFIGGDGTKGSIPCLEDDDRNH